MYAQIFHINHITLIIPVEPFIFFCKLSIMKKLSIKAVKAYIKTCYKLINRAFHVDLINRMHSYSEFPKAIAHDSAFINLYNKVPTHSKKPTNIYNITKRIHCFTAGLHSRDYVIYRQKFIKIYILDFLMLIKLMQ